MTKTVVRPSEDKTTGADGDAPLAPRPRGTSPVGSPSATGVFGHPPHPTLLGRLGGDCGRSEPVARCDGRARTRGFEGRLVVMGENELAVGDCRIEWADGGLVRDSAATEAAITQAVDSYVALRRGGGER